MRILNMLAVALLALTAPAGAEDWPRWRGPESNAISQETGLLKAWPTEGPRELWRAPLGEGYSCMAVAQGRVFTQFQKDDAQWVVALKEETGAELWKKQTGKKFNNSFGSGPRSTPTVDGDRVFVLDAQGNLLCLKAADGKEVWWMNVLNKFKAKNLTWGVSMSPLIDGEKLLINVGESKGASIVAFNKATGEVLWQGLDDKAGYSSPQAAELSGVKQYVFFAGRRALGVDAGDGKLLWDYGWKTSYDANIATPIIDGDTVFLTSGYNHGGALLKIDPPAKPPVQALWESRAIRSHFGTPILLDGHLYGFDEKKFTCVELATGKVKWAEAGFNKGAHVYADGLCYILGEKGRLALTRISPAKFEIVSETPEKLVGPKCWTMPVVANGRLYLRDEEKLICLDVKAK